MEDVFGVVAFGGGFGGLEVFGGVASDCLRGFLSVAVGVDHQGHYPLDVDWRTGRPLGRLAGGGVRAPGTLSTRRRGSPNGLTLAD